MTTPKHTAILRRYNGITGELEVERKSIIPVQELLDSFHELWPYHRKLIQPDGIFRVLVYSTAGRYEGWNADYYFTIEPLND